METLRPIRSSRVSPGFWFAHRRHDGEGAVRSVRIRAGVDLHRRGIRQAVAQVHGLALRLAVVCVDQHELRKQARCMRLKAMDAPTKPQPITAAFL